MASTPVASPGTEEDPPLIDLLKYGAWGVASRDFEQIGEFPGYAIIIGTSIGAFPDPETAAAAMPAIRSVQDLDPYNQLELTEIDSLGDDQFFLWGPLTSQGVDLTVGLLIVERGPYAVLASGVGVAGLDFRSDLVDIVEFILSGAEAADPQTKDGLMDVLPNPDDLPHLPTSDNFLRSFPGTHARRRRRVAIGATSMSDRNEAGRCCPASRHLIPTGVCERKT